MTTRGGGEARRRPRRLGCLGLVVAAAAGCGGGGGSVADGGSDGGPLDSPLDAGTDAARADAGPPEPGGFAWEDCHGGFRCADFPVPRDHDTPDGATIDVRVLRAPASRPAERIGVLIFQPGGPGAPAVSLAAETFIPTLRLVKPEITARFDIVAVEPRGVGESSPVIDCVDDASLDAMRELDAAPDDEAEWTALTEYWQSYVDGCVERTGTELLDNVTRDDLVRDIELVRQALGEDEINCLCDGAYVGARYASLFPERVRAFSLVSVSDPTPPPRLGEQWTPAASYEQELAAFFEQCGADAGCGFHGGGGATMVRDAFEALLTELESSPIELGDGRVLGSLNFRAGVVGALRDPAEPTLGEALAAAETGDGAPLMGKADGYFGRAEDGSYSAFVEANTAMGFAGNPCPAGYDLPAFRTDLQETIADSPHLGPLLLARDHACVYWPEVGSKDPDITATTAPPLLLVNNTDDPQTPLSQAMEMQSALANGSYLVAHEGAGHGAAIYASPCVLDAIEGFFLDPATPPATDTCVE